MTSQKKASGYMREVPEPEADPEPMLYMLDKWGKLEEALKDDAEILAVAFPEVLGDTYTELIINLGKLASSGKRLAITNPSPWLVHTRDFDLPISESDGT